MVAEVVAIIEETESVTVREADKLDSDAEGVDVIVVVVVPVEEENAREVKRSSAVATVRMSMYFTSIAGCARMICLRQFPLKADAWGQ